MRTSQGTVLVGLLLLGTLAIASAQDVSVVLAKYPQYSKFNELLKSTGVLTEVNTRSSLSILLPDDGVLNGYVSSHPSYTTQMMADVIRYHCLLQYFSPEDLMALTASTVVTTLYQTTGRANGLDGFVNVTKQAGSLGTVGPSTLTAPVQANIIMNVTQYPYNYTFYQISGVLEPLGLAAAQLAPTTPPTMAPASVPAPIMESPMVAPTMAPTIVPTMAPPMMAPVQTPTMAPSTTPVMAPPMMTPPVVAPTTPMANAPVAEGPMMSVSSAFALEFNFVAVVVSVFVAALLF